MTALPTLKLRVLPTFPSTVIGAGGIVVTKTAGVYTISLDPTASSTADPSATIGLTATLGLATTSMRSDAAPALSQAIVPTWTQPHIFNPVSGTAITVNTAALSTAKALSVTQSTPSTGTTAGPFSSNVWNLTYSIRTTGSGADATGNNNAGAVGFRVNQTITTAGVASTSAPIITGLFTATVSTTTAITDVTGLAGTAYTAVAMSGAYLEALNGVAMVGSGGSANILVGLDVGAQILTGGTATNRFGISVLSAGAVNGITRDAAIVFNSNTATQFNNVFLFSNFSGTAPIGASTSIFKADTTYTIAGFANLPTTSVSGYVLQFDKLGLAGDGRMILGGASNTVAALPTVLTAQVTSGGRVALNSSTNITTGLNGVDVINSTSGSEAFIQVNEANRTAVRFGQTSGNWAEIGSFGGNGLLFGTEDSAPLLIGTNNTNRMQITAGGQVNIGTYVAPATNAALTVNKNAAVLKNTTLVPLLHLGSTDSTQSVAIIDGFGGAGQQPFVICRNARGTGASPTAVSTSDQLGFFGMVGATGAGTYAAENGTAGGAFFGAVATEPWSLTAQGCKIIIYTTPNTTAAIAAALTIQQSGGISVGTAADPGVGKIATTTAYNVGSTQVVQARVTGYTAMTGSPDKASAYATGSVTLAQLAGRVAQLQADLTTHGLIGT